jgi:hypothetical protein
MRAIGLDVQQALFDMLAQTTSLLMIEPSCPHREIMEA